MAKSSLPRRRLLFLSGTRADFGKIKPLLNCLQNSEDFEVFIFTTGMHMLRKYGSTWDEVVRSNLGSVYMFVNQNQSDSMDSILAKTISGLSDFVKEIAPDLVIVHGDRVEALAGALVGTLNRIPVAHVEGGEVSGTIDESIRHTITKLSTLHFVSNKDASTRLMQLGESQESIFEIGSPEVDVMSSAALPSLIEVRKKYDIRFSEFNILIFHPVTTEISDIPMQAKAIVDFVLSSNENFLVIMPNNDDGTNKIQSEYLRFAGVETVRLLPSMRFEYYLTALKNCGYIIGNSSSGVREASFFGVPTVNLGSRQMLRANSPSIVNAGFDQVEIVSAVHRARLWPRKPLSMFGDGKTGSRFMRILQNPSTWQIPLQKTFVDRSISNQE